MIQAIRPDVVVSYPPDYDGELHIQVEHQEDTFSRKNGGSYRYSFVHAAKGDSWETLVAAARGIIAQEERRQQTKV